MKPINNRIIQKSSQRFHVDRQKLFQKVLSNADFTKCKNSLDAVSVMFNQLFPVIEQVTTDNEILLEDQAKQMQQFADLDEKYKMLRKDYDKIQEAYEEATGERFSEDGDEGVSENQQSLLLQEGGSVFERDSRLDHLR